MESLWPDLSFITNIPVCVGSVVKVSHCRSLESRERIMSYLLYNVIDLFCGKYPAALAALAWAPIVGCC